MNKKLIRVVIPVLIVIEFSFIFLTFMSYQNKDINSIKETSKVDKERFAMYVENMDGEYEEVNKIPLFGRYLLNEEKTICVDNKGNELENVLTYNDNKVTVTSNKTLFCYLYFDMKIDVQIDVETDGEAGKVPTSLGYTKSITCEDGTTPTWNYKYNRLEFTGINSDETRCKLTNTKDNNTYENLKDVVENDKNIVTPTYLTGDYSNSIPLSENQYLNVETYRSNYNSSLSGIEATNYFLFSNGTWSSIPENFYAKYYYHLKAYIPEDGYYQLCYNLPAGNTTNYMYIYVNSNIQMIDWQNYLVATSTADKNGCLDLGFLTPSDFVKIVQYSSSSTKSTFTFNLQKGEEKINELGYRYTGTNPNNYIWFNNEMWRIIGSIPTKVSADGVTENLVKIIRKDPIGHLIYDYSRPEDEWGTNTLYKILNDYYYLQKDATGLKGCSTDGLINTSINCDYTTTGISNHYGKMIKEVYWNTGVSGKSAYSSEEFYNSALESFVKHETSTQTLQSKIGIMTASDYGLSASKDYHSNRIGSYDTEPITKSNWLFNSGSEWISTSVPKSYDHWEITSSGDIKKGNYKDSHNNAVRPVVYLDNSVYITEGDGTEANPYQVAMK